MGFSATTAANRALLISAQAPQYEIYHCNSRLNVFTARLLSEEAEPNPVSRYLGTRGFRQFETDGAVPLMAPALAQVSLQQVLLRRRSGRSFGGSISLTDLSTVLEQALGCTSVLEEEESRGLAHALRAWPSAGGLYPLDCYVLALRVNDLPPDIYHYNAIRQQLEPLGEMDIHCSIGPAFFAQGIVSSAAAVLVFVANFERTTSKYGERGYRLVLLDSGHAAQNVLLVAEQLELGATAIGSFHDDELSKLLQVDGVDEAPVHAVVIGKPA